MSRNEPTRGPLFILGAPRSNTSLVCAMLGQHPELYGMPELNLFCADSMDDFWIRFTGAKQFMRHGLLRTVAQLYGGEQNMRTVEMAMLWCQERLQKTTAEVHHELCAKVAPRMLVDKSPTYVFEPQMMMRIQAAFPDAYFLHLVRHPMSQGKSMLKFSQLALVIMDSIDYSGDEPAIDPQILWYRVQRNILAFLPNVAPERRLLVKAENILGSPREELTRICEWLGISTDDIAIDEMLHPEQSPYAGFGPIGANLGNDPNFLRSPAFRGGAVAPASLLEPLPWRPDGRGFYREVIQMALRLGYELPHGAEAVPAAPSAGSDDVVDEVSATEVQGGYGLQRALISGRIQRKRAFVQEFMSRDPTLRNPTVYPTSSTPQETEQRRRDLEYRRSWLFAALEEADRELTTTQTKPEDPTGQNDGSAAADRSGTTAPRPTEKKAD